MPAYAKIVGLASQVAYAYRFQILFQLIGLLLQIFLLKVVWTAVYADRASVEGVDLATLLTFLTIANLQIWIIFPEGGEDLQQKVREGKIAQDLARPVGLLGQLLAYQLGMTLGFLPMILVATPVAFVVGVLQAPASPEAALLYGLSVVLAYAVVALMGLILGLVAFWTLETTGMWAIYRFANLFFAGGLVPLWLFPGPLRTVAELLPFQTQAHIPVSIYIGRLAGTDAARGLLIQAAWILILALVVRFVWSKALRRVVVQGG
ncbi:MAG: ABC transporter permease [Candidatus Limnocylindria bacterium]